MIIIWLLDDDWTFILYAEAFQQLATEVVVPEEAWRIYVIIRSYVTMLLHVQRGQKVCFFILFKYF